MPRQDPIGLLMRTTRRAQGLRLREVAAVAGISISHLWAVERGERVDLTIATLERIARALGLRPCMLLGGGSCPHRRQRAKPAR